MQDEQAAENLKTIRTLMERTALYRRALAPLLLGAGALGMAGAAAGCLIPQLEDSRKFLIFWLSIAVLGVVGSLLQVRRQALHDGEPFWSPPTRRVAQSILPPLTSGFMLSLLCLFVDQDEFPALLIIPVWMVFYGCALHAAGFCMTRGVRLLGWLFVAGGIAGFFCMPFIKLEEMTAREAHLLMGVVFGALQFAGGVWVLFTERQRKVA
jgi:hypothetical protein